MLARFKLSVLLQSLTLFLLGPAYEASSLGLTVHVVPLNSNGGNTVRAHFTVIAPSPCPPLSGVCAVGDDCLVHTTSFPFTGAKPSSGFCVRQWQKTVPSKYSATISLGSNTEFYVSMNAGPIVRANSGRLNQPAFVALPPPLRARVNCPHHFHLSVKDLDGDKVRCRFARPDLGECLNCIKHAFIELDEGNCMLSFTGQAPAGQYFIYLMAEDLIPVPKNRYVIDNPPLSSVPVHLSLTVEESTSSCTDEPVATAETPQDKSVLHVLPYQEVDFNVGYTSNLESVLEIAVVGPPKLHRTGFISVDPLARMTMAWVCSPENNLPHLLPICFAANTKSLQSEPRCVWLRQSEVGPLPAGTELKCEKTEMTLVLPIATLTNINLNELQLNSPTCPVIYNSTHLTASISLSGCGTKTVHSGSELVYTNTLQSVRPFTMISRQPSLILPLACRIPEVQAQGPHYEVGIPTETEAFGVVGFWLEFHFPGQGPQARFTSNPRLRSNFVPQRRARREAGTGSGMMSNSMSSGSSNSTRNSTSGGIGSRIKQLDLHVMSNSSVHRAELMVNKCIQSETRDFAESRCILENGCMTSMDTVEIVTTETILKIYRLDLSALPFNGPMMYVQCTVNLCITTQPSQKCPDLCNEQGSINVTGLVGSVFSSMHVISSGPVSLVVTTPAPLTTKVTTTSPTATAAETTIITTTTSHAPDQTSSMAIGVILTTITMFLQKIVLY